MDSITEILRKLKDGEDVAICDIYSSIAMSGKQGDEQRLAALIGYATRFTFTEILGLPTVNHEFTSLSDVQVITLTPECRRVSIVATGSDIRYEVYNTNDGPVIEYLIFAHLILQNERIDIRVNPNSAIRFLSLTEGTLHVSELA